jgi:hypothetical protein
LLVARKLVRRLLPEELSRGCALTSPGAGIAARYRAE